MCLALPRAEYVGRYVAPDGSDWVERFPGIYRHVDSIRHKAPVKETQSTRLIG